MVMQATHEVNLEILIRNLNSDEYINALFGKKPTYYVVSKEPTIYDGEGNLCSPDIMIEYVIQNKNKEKESGIILIEYKVNPTEPALRKGELQLQKAKKALKEIHKGAYKIRTFLITSKYHIKEIS